MLELAGLPLNDESHLAGTYIPRIESHELDGLREEARGNHIFISFDDMSRLSEAVNVTDRFRVINFTEVFWTLLTKPIREKGILDSKTWIQRVGNDEKNRLMKEAADEMSNVRNEADGGKANETLAL